MIWGDTPIPPSFYTRSSEQGVMDQIRFGIIGLRRGQSFVRVCRAVGGAVVSAFYDPYPARAQPVGGELEAPGFGDLESFFEADIDAVVIALPLPYHAPQTIAAP